MLILVFSFVVAVVVCMGITPLVVRVASARGLLDVPLDGRRVHKKPVPRIGGIAVFLAMALGLVAAALVDRLDLLAVGSNPRFLLSVLLGGGIMFLAGLWDDLRGLRPVVKLTAQVVAAVAAFGLGLRVDVIGLGSTEFVLGGFALPVTVLWVVGVTNAFNLIDGLDGLATGIAIVALATTLAVALALGNVEVAVVCAALLGALCGFLTYNFNPARIFLGDSGSLFIGFMLAVLSVHGSMKSATAVLVIVPLFALAIPLLDTTLAILRRWLRGVPLSGADSRHIHHQLLALGLTHRRAAIILYVVASALASFGLLIAFAPPAAVVGIAIAGGALSILLLLYGMRQLEYHEFVEAGAVLASGLMRVRRIIQDQIHARDLAQMLDEVGSIAQLDRMLEMQASAFGFLGMEVCRESSACRQRLVRANGVAARAWKIDYPVTPRESVTDDPYVLRIWCGFDRSYRPFGAERVARVLAPAIELWLVRAGLVAPAPKAADPRAETYAVFPASRRSPQPGLDWKAQRNDISPLVPAASDGHASEAAGASRNGAAGR